MTTVALEFESGLLDQIGTSPERLSNELRLAAAIYWYARGRVSQGRGAEIANLSKSEFIDALAASGVSPVQETIEDLREVLGRA